MFFKNYYIKINTAVRDSDTYGGVVILMGRNYFLNVL